MHTSSAYVLAQARPYILLCMQVDARATPNCDFELIAIGYKYDVTCECTGTLNIAFRNLTSNLVPLPDFDCDLPQGVEL